MPLPKSSSRDESQTSFILDIVWINDTKDSMTERGHLQFLLPEVDLPLNKVAGCCARVELTREQVYASVFTPSDYRIGEFTGDISEVTRFSGTPPSSQVYLDAWLLSTDCD